MYHGTGTRNSAYLTRIEDPIGICSYGSLYSEDDFPNETLITYENMDLGATLPTISSILIEKDLVANKEFYFSGMTEIITEEDDEPMV